jgi:hypothetical protein
MRLVYWGRKQVSEQRTEGAMNEFRAALTKWNDNLNRNLALAYRYFGATFGGLSGALYEEVAVTGRHLEDRYRNRHEPGLPAEGAARLYISGRTRPVRTLMNCLSPLRRGVVVLNTNARVGAGR